MPIFLVLKRILFWYFHVSSWFAFSLWESSHFKGPVLFSSVTFSEKRVIFLFLVLSDIFMHSKKKNVWKGAPKRKARDAVVNTIDVNIERHEESTCFEPRKTRFWRLLWHRFSKMISVGKEGGAISALSFWIFVVDWLNSGFLPRTFILWDMTVFFYAAGNTYFFSLPYVGAWQLFAYKWECRIMAG